jgi:hypothetical protein
VLLDRAAGGDKAALAALLARQNVAAGSDLAIAVSTWWGSLSEAAQQRLMGYNAPQLDLKLSPSALSPQALAGDSEVAFEADAKSAATSLDSFSWGLHAAHDPAFAAHTVGSPGSG